MEDIMDIEELKNNTNEQTNINRIPESEEDIAKLYQFLNEKLEYVGDSIIIYDGTDLEDPKCSRVIFISREQRPEYDDCYGGIGVQMGYTYPYVLTSRLFDENGFEVKRQIAEFYNNWKLPIHINEKQEIVVSADSTISLQGGLIIRSNKNDSFTEKYFDTGAPFLPVGQYDKDSFEISRRVYLIVSSEAEKKIGQSLNENGQDAIKLRI